MIQRVLFGRSNGFGGVRKFQGQLAIAVRSTTGRHTPKCGQEGNWGRGRLAGHIKIYHGGARGKVDCRVNDPRFVLGDWFDGQLVALQRQPLLVSIVHISKYSSSTE